MKLNNEIVKLVAELEYLMGSEFYHPDMYNTDYDCYGKKYRYPITFPRDDKKTLAKTKCNLNVTSFITDVTPHTINKMYYKIGAHEMYVGRGIIQILEYLESHYDIDFNEICKK